MVFFQECLRYDLNSKASESDWERKDGKNVDLKGELKSLRP